MDVATQIQRYLEEQFSPARKGIRLTADTLLLEEKVFDSIGMLELLSFVEETFGIQVAEDDIEPEHFSTISRLTAYINSKRQQPAN